jgi:hypothetical protein
MKRSHLEASAPFLRRVTLLADKADPTRHPFDIEALRGGLDDGPIHEVAYADTAHYKLTKEFLDSPERFFKHLFA